MALPHHHKGNAEQDAHNDRVRDEETAEMLVKEGHGEYSTD
jgi:hypothetical protein